MHIHCRDVFTGECIRCVGDEQAGLERSEPVSIRGAFEEGRLGAHVRTLPTAPSPVTTHYGKIIVNINFRIFLLDSAAPHPPDVHAGMGLRRDQLSCGG